MAGNGSIAGKVFLDANGNALADTGDAGVAGVAVTLQTETGTAIATTTTDIEGNYAFTDVTEGNYLVAAAASNGRLPEGPTSVHVGSTSITGQDLALYTLQPIAGFVYAPSGAPIDGIIVTLFDARGSIVAQTSSAPNAAFPHGVYQFDGIPPGTYTVQAVDPDSTAQSPPRSTTVVSGVPDYNQSVTLLPARTGTGVISGQTFYDADGDKALDAVDQVVPGITVTLTDANGSFIASAQTGSDGTYSFRNLVEGSYTVAFPNFPGLVIGTAAPGLVTLGTGQAVAGVNAGYTTPSTVVGLAYSDANGSGAPDPGETGLNGVTVKLVDNATGIIAATTTTSIASGSDGFYSFSVTPGSYSVQFVQPGDNLLTTPSSVDVGTLAPGGGAVANAGIRTAGSGSIQGSVFIDADADGAINGYDTGLSGVAIILKNAAGAIVGTANSDRVGHYSFAGLAAGPYTVSAAAPTGKVADNAAPLSVTVADHDVPNQNIGFFTPTLIAGQVFSDVDRDGVKDANEIFLDGVTVHLLDANGTVVDTTTSVASTANPGLYIFQNVRPGSYKIQVEIPGDASPQAAVSTGALVGGVPLFNFNVPAAIASPPITGTIFSDPDRDGLQDTGEAGLAGTGVMLVKNAGMPQASVLAATTTDASGHYTFTGMFPGSYTVVAAAPSGDQATSPQQLLVGPTASNAIILGDFGFAADPTPNAAPFPKATTINMIVRGQSNITYFTQEGYLAQLKTAIERSLGFDGVNQKINLLADDATLHPGTGLLRDWLSPIDGDYRNGWAANDIERQFLSDIARQSDAFKAAPTLVLWLHNESDSGVSGVTADEWMSAARFEAGLVRAALGQTADTVPYLFVNPIPFLQFGNITRDEQNSVEQNIKIGMSTLAADPVFNAKIVAQLSDVTMDHDGAINGPHLNATDDRQLLDRLSRSIPQFLAASAQSGSPLAQASGHIDDVGPQVVSASTVAGHTDQLLLTVVHDEAIGFAALDPDAANGLGWSIRNTASGAGSALLASATHVEIVDETHLRITFDHEIPVAGKLFYAWGADRLAPTLSAPGNGKAVYDTNKLPIWTDPNGLAVMGTGTPPPAATGSITGTVFLDDDADGLRNGSDAGLSGATVTLANAAGQIVGTATSDAQGHYAFTAVADGTYGVSVVPPAGRGADSAVPLPVSVAGGAAATAPDLGVYTPQPIAGFVYGPDGTAVDGIAVDLYDANGTLVATATSAPFGGFPHGVYLFNAVPPGAYTVQASDPASTAQSPPLATVVANGPDFGQNLTLLPARSGSASISGRAFIDANGNGIAEAGEAGLPGRSVTLTDAAGHFVASGQTASDGSYSFTKLDAGTYALAFAAQPGLVIDTAVPATVMLGTGQAVFGLNAGYAQPVAIYGVAYTDANGNGIPDAGEAGLNGVTVKLVSDTTGQTVATTTTAALQDQDGFYAFSAAPGAYSVQFVPPAGKPAYTPSVVDFGQIGPGETKFAQVGIGATGTGSVSGTVFADANGDAVLGTGDTGIAGAAVVLRSAAGTTLATSTSDAQGRYSFAEIADGTYTVSVAAPAGKVADNAAPLPVTIANGNASTGQNIGFYAPAAIAGFVFTDANKNGQPDQSEWTDGVSVLLLDAQGHVVGSTVSAGNASFVHGVYQFDTVKPGTYSVQAVADGKPSLAIGAVLGGQGVYGRHLSVPAAAASTTGTITGFAFNDLNGNGLFDGDESAVNGEIVELLNFNRDPIARAVTGPGAPLASVSGLDGAYAFTGVAPGTYSLRFTAPDGQFLTTPVLNAVGTLAAGQSIGLNSGLASSAGTIRVSGTAFDDANGNGRPDAGEAGHPGVDVLLVKDAGTASAVAIKTAVADSEGHYGFNAIPAGTYSVVFATPAGLEGTSPTTVSVGALTTGQSATADLGLHVDPTPGAGPIPQTSVVNVIVRGQSNAQNFSDPDFGNAVGAMKTQLETLLGFDGIHQRVNVIADFGKPDGANTINSGTGMLADWLSPVKGDYQNGWTAKTLELGLLTDLAQHSDDLSAGPTAVVWFHNEHDGSNPSLTTDMWSSAVRYEAGLVRGLIGKDAGAVPYLFVDAMAFPTFGGTPAAQHDVLQQMIKLGMEQLAADPVFNARIAAQLDDIDQDEFDAGIFSGHINNTERQLLAGRLAESLAQTFASSARPGSPVALAGGQVDDLGPRVIEARAVAGHADQLLLTVAQDAATGFEALDPDAAAGVGWSVRSGTTGATLQASGTAVTIVDPTHLRVTFDAGVAGGKLFYAWGANPIARPGQGGFGNAVYDSNHMPIWAQADGVALAGAPAIAGIDATGSGIAGGAGLLKAGAAVRFTTTFDTAVTVDTTRGTPTLTLSDGAVATYLSGSGTDRLVFTTTVAQGENSPDLAVTGLVLHGATIRDGGGNDAVLAGAALNPPGLLVIDTARPVIQATAPASRIEAASAAGAAVAFSATATDAVDGTDAVTFREGANVVTSGQVFGRGTHTVTASAADAAGNAADPVSFTFTVSDTTRPAILVTPPAATIQAQSSAGAAVTFAGTATDAVDGTDTVIFREGTRVVASGDTFGVGRHTITASAHDAAGNEAAPIDVTFTVAAPPQPPADTVKPVLAVQKPAASFEATSAAGASVSFPGTASDAVDGPVAVTFREGATVVTSGRTFALGGHTVTASATDAARNEADPVSFSFTVADTTRPVISVMPATASVTATSAAGAAVTFSGSARDAVDGTDAVVFSENGRSVASGDTFGVGVHTIAAAATDRAGNAADPVAFSFTVGPAPSPAVVSGRAIDGYLAGATVFADANRNGRLDPGEVSTTTDARGAYALAAGTATLVATGGTDSATGLAFGGVLSAPTGSTVITPLTTLVDQVARANGGDLSAAQLSVKAALGLGVTTDLRSLDPIAAVEAGQAGAATAFAAGAALLTTATLAAAAGAVDGFFAALGTQIARAPTPVDLTDAGTIATLVRAAGAGNAAATAAAVIASASNAVLVQTVQAAAGDPVKLLAAVATISRTAQGPTADALKAAGNDAAHLADVVSDAIGGGLPGGTTGSGGTVSINHAPRAVDDLGTVQAHASLTGNLLANDGDPDAGDRLALVGAHTGTAGDWKVAAGPGVTLASEHGHLTLATDGSYRFIADRAGGLAAGQTTVDAFTYTVIDGHGATATGHLSVAVTGAAQVASETFTFAFTDARVLFRDGSAVLTGPDGVAHDVTGIETLTFTDGTIRERDGAALVYDMYYDAHNLDVWRAHVDPDAHYAAFGWHEGRDPSAAFSTSAYLAANPDVARAGVDPLLHYDAFGWHEGRTAGPGFSGDAYLAANPDVARAGVDPLLHYLTFGQAEGRSSYPGQTGAHLQGDFDAAYYLARNPDVAAAVPAGGNADVVALRHYLAFGAAEGRDPDAYFSTKGYLAANPDVAAAHVNPLLHYETYGWQEGRDPGPGFHGAAYLAANPDVAAAHIDPLLHFLQFGQAEGRHAV